MTITTAIHEILPQLHDPEVALPVESLDVVAHETTTGAMWCTIGTIAVQVLMVINNAVVCRFVLPSAYGNVAMALVVVALTGLFVEFGMTPAITAGRIKDPQTLVSCHWMICLIGLLMGAISFAASPVVAYFFGNRHVIPLLEAASLLLVVNSWRAVPFAAIEAAGRFDRIALISSISQVAACITGITVAMLGGREWAVLAPALTIAVVGTVSTIAISPMRIRLTFSWAHLKPHLTEGSHLLTNSFTEYVFNTSDQIVVGKLLGSYILGCYNFGGNLVTRLLGMVTPNIAYPLMSALGRTDKNIDSVDRAAVKAGVAISRITFPCVLGGILVAPQLIRTLAGPNWVQCTELVQVLFFMAAFQSLIQLAIFIWVTMGHSKLVMYWGLTTNIAVLAVFFGGAYWGRSAEAVAISYMLYGVCVLTPMCIYCTRRWCGIPLKGLGTGLFWILPDIAAMGIVVWSVGFVMIRAAVPAPITLLLQVLAGASTYALCFRMGNAAELSTILAVLPTKIKSPMSRLLRLTLVESPV